jgi:hypothetical protein
MILLIAVVTVAMSLLVSFGRWADDVRRELRGQHAANAVALALGAGEWSMRHSDELAAAWNVSIHSRQTTDGVVDVVVEHRRRYFRAAAFAPTLDVTHE